tara:strand:+ start:446 stop:643 length:198 start_codon:yes stop_codon:yes gene_type:complete
VIFLAALGSFGLKSSECFAACKFPKYLIIEGTLVAARSINKIPERIITRNIGYKISIRYPSVLVC